VSQTGPVDTVPEPPDRPARRSRFIPDWLRPHTAGQAIAAVVTTGAALVAIATGIVELRGRMSSAPSDPEVRLVAAALEERSTDLGDGRIANRVSYTVEYRGGPHQIAVAYALFDSNRLRSIHGAPGLNPVGEYLGYVLADLPAGNGRYSGRVEVPIPMDGYCVFVRVYLLDYEPSTSVNESWLTTAPRLEYADTPPFHTHMADEACETPVPTAASS
jgi:hypothetical protein